MRLTMLLLIPGSGLSAGERFDHVVRDDFFVGFVVDREAVLAGNPKALVSVIIPRGATLLEASHHIPGDAGQELLRGRASGFKSWRP